MNEARFVPAGKVGMRREVQRAVSSMDALMCERTGSSEKYRPLIGVISAVVKPDAAAIK